jgi:hypothetical protein
MARRKTSKRRSRRGRVGGVLPKKYQSDTYMAVGVVGGMLLARMIPGAIQKVAPGASPLVTNLVQAGIGIAGAVSTAKMPLLRGASLGIAGMGLLDAATNAGWLPNSQGVKEQAPATPAVGRAREVLIDLDGGARNRLAGAVGKGYTGNFAANRLAGNALAGMGLI